LFAAPMMTPRLPAMRLPIREIGVGALSAMSVL
jgi:hypothetical protein